MKFSLSFTLLTVLFLSCTKDDSPGKSFTGFFYTSTNATAGNAIIALGRKQDGTVEELNNSPYATGSAGDAADGDFDTQGALRIVGDYLLGVNAGANPVNSTISVFRIDKANGTLTQVDQNPATAAMDNINSGGARATSIATKTIGAATWVVVGNQFANPHYEGNPPVAVGSVMSSPLRNLAVFTFDQTSGILQFKNIGATYTNGENGGPTDVEFNSTGTKLAVSTWGVTHIMTPEQDLTLQKPSRLIIYSFSSGTLSETGNFTENGLSGSIGLSWSPTDKYVYLSNFNLHSSKEGNSLTVHDGITAAKVQNFATGARNDEACWTWVSLDKTKLYVTSFAENGISVFDVLSGDLIAKTLEPNFFAKKGNLPEGDAKDLYETPNGFLYNIGAFQSHSVSTFKTSPNGLLTEITGSPYFVPSSKGKSKDQHAYLGLTGFEKEIK